jgi:A118 family predicted phage portal protein
MFSSFWAKIKEFFARMFGLNHKIEETLHVTPAVSDQMTEAIDLWTDMYMDNAPWLHEPDAEDKTRVVSLGLPAFISGEKARMAVLELKSEITAPTKTERKTNPNYFPPISDAFGNIRASGEAPTIVEEKVQGDTRRATYLNEQYHKKLLSKIRTQLEYGTAKGSLIIKPYVVRSKVTGVAGIATDKQDGKQKEKNEKEQYQYKMEYDFIQADCFYPFSFDGSGNLTDVAFIQTITRGDKIYTRLERHKLNVNDVMIENYAFESTNSNNQEAYSGIGGITLGSEIKLTDVPEWKDIPPKATIKNVDRLLFGYFKMPDANIIDTHSPLGMSCFGKAANLIKDADMQYSRLLWEFEGGELAIDIDRDALQFLNGDQGGSVMSQLQNRLYRPVDLGESDTYKPFSPSLRDISLINGLNNILMRIEDVCALSRGTLSDVAAEARTATEIKILKQRSFSSNKEIQSALQTALEDVIYAMNVYVTLYNIVGDIKYDSNGNVDTSKMGSYDVSFEWDDSILIDEETELATRLSLMEKGLESKLELRMWYFGETEKQAQEALDKIQDENRQAIEQNMVMSSQLGKQVSGGETPGEESKQDEQDSKQKNAQQAPNQSQSVPQMQGNNNPNNGTQTPVTP